MKKIRSTTLLMIVTIAFACVMSCDEQDQKLETRNAFNLKSKSSDAANSRVGAVEFNGTEGDPLDLATAKKWTSNFRKGHENPDEILAHYFGTEIIQGILNQSGCVGIRIYYAIDDTGEKKLLLVGVDSNGQNLLPVEGGKTNEEVVVADYSYPCPTYCPQNDL